MQPTPLEARKQAIAVMKQIMNTLSAADGEEYKRKTTNWKKNNRADASLTQSLQAANRITIREFVARRPQITRLHNDRADLQIISGVKSPLPAFHDLVSSDEDTAGTGAELESAGDALTAPQQSSNHTKGRESQPQVRPLAAEKSVQTMSLPKRGLAVQEPVSPDVIMDRPRNTVVENDELYIMIINPDAFPTHLIEDWGDTSIVKGSMEEVREAHKVISITAFLQKSEYHMLTIHRENMLSIVGASNQPGVLVPLIGPQPKLRIVESIGDGMKKGCRLELARHPFLEWLELKGTVVPQQSPTEDECWVVAQKQQRMYQDVKAEIFGHWNKEQDPTCGQHYRQNRRQHLGEEPSLLNGEQLERPLS